MFIIINKKKLYVLVASLVLIVSLFFMLGNETQVFGTNKKAYVAIVIDDFGNHSDGTEEMMNLGIPITAAIMPFMPSSKTDAEKAKEKGIETIVHMPMEPEYGRASWLGPRGITTNLSDEEIKKRVKEAFEEIQGAVGLNNHMGSKIMQDEKALQDILEVVKEKDKLFLDSKTTANSKAEAIAKNLGIKYYSRDIFLDNDKDIAAIERQLDKAANMALKEGKVIAIGHVGAEGGKVTARAIKNKMKEMEDKGIEFVFLSKIE